MEILVMTGKTNLYIIICCLVCFTKATLQEKFDVPLHAAEMKSDGDGSKYGDSSGDGKTILYIIVFC